MQSSKRSEVKTLNADKVHEKTNPLPIGFHMKNENISDNATCAGLLRYALAIPFIFLALAAGCRDDKPAVGDNTLAFRSEMQSKLNIYTIGLVDPMAKNNRKKIKAVLEKIHSVSTPHESDGGFSLSVLDNHGVTVASKAGSETAGTQNYGNYHVVARVIQKRKPFQSTLYLQGGRKIYIICSPLIKGEKVVGVLIIGIDPAQMTRLGISENEFMSLKFTARNGGRP